MRGMMGGGREENEQERVAAFFSMLDRWSRAEGAVHVNTSKPPSELLDQSGRSGSETAELMSRPFEAPHP
jgi:hypothetical protein